MKSASTCLLSLELLENAWNCHPQFATMAPRFRSFWTWSFRLPVRSSLCVSKTMVHSLILHPSRFSSFSKMPFSHAVIRPSCITSNTTHCPGWQNLLHFANCCWQSFISSWKKSGVSTTYTGTPNGFSSTLNVHSVVTGTELESDLKSCSGLRSGSPASRMVFADALFPVPLNPRRTTLKLFSMKKMNEGHCCGQLIASGNNYVNIFRISLPWDYTKNKQVTSKQNWQHCCWV